MPSTKILQRLLFILSLLGQSQIFAQANQWSAPDNLVTAALGTGQTTGHIATLSVKNTGDIPQSLDIGMFYIPSEGKYQGYVSFPQSEITTIEPGTTVEIPINGVCINVDKPPVPMGNTMPPTSDWFVPSGDFNPDLPPGFSYNPDGVSTVPRPNDGTSVTNIPLDLTNDPTQTISVDADKNPSTAAQFLFDAVTRIQTTVDQMQSLGAIRTPFSNNTNKENEAIVQQTVWIYSSALIGNDYTKDQFADRLQNQFENTSGVPLADATDEQKEQFNSGVDQFWNTFELVGLEAKVISASSDGEVESAVDETAAENAAGEVSGVADDVVEDAESAVENMTDSPQQTTDETTDDEDEDNKSCECGEITFSVNIRTTDGKYDRNIDVYTGGEDDSVSEIDASAAGAKAGDRIEIEVSDISFECACEEAPCETKATRPSYLSRKKKKGAKAGSYTILPKVGNSNGNVVINNEDNSEITIELTEPEDESSESIQHIIAIQAICENSDCDPIICIGHATIAF